MSKSKKIILISVFLLICACVVAFLITKKDKAEAPSTEIVSEESVSFSHPEQLYFFKATVLETEESSVLVEPVKGSVERSSSDKIYVYTDNADTFKKGDLVNISYDGMIQELYPARIPEASVYYVTECVDKTLFRTACGYSGHISDDALYTFCLNNNKMHISSVRHLPIFKLETEEQLKQFRMKYFDRPKGYDTHDGMPFFDDTVAHCDEEFFKDNVLFAVYVEAPSGSFRYGITDVIINGNTFFVEASQINDPEAYTCDVVSWFLTVSAKKETVQDCTVFDAILNSP